MENWFKKERRSFGMKKTKEDAAVVREGTAPFSPARWMEHASSLASG
jgi:hypothetical protein